jgi:hypothetical protein
MAPNKSASLRSAVPYAANAANRQPERAQERGTERTEERRLERPDNRRMTDDGRFSIDLNRVPPGYVMEFKRHEIMGMKDNRNKVLVEKYHWKPVPHSVQPHFYGSFCKNEDEQVVVDGMGLYMRPAYLNEEARAEHRADTDYVLGQQMKALRGESAEQVGPGNSYFKKQSIPVPQAVE